MAVYEQTRPRPLAPGMRRASAPADRRPRRATTRAQRRTGPISFILVAILAIFLLGLLYLTQTLSAATVSYEIDQARSHQAELRREIQTQQGTIARWGAQPQVVEWAQQNGLGRLGTPIRIPPR
ncbi:MAG: hypothetical protein ABIZ34_06385 [Candidatus Limnocylindrales bacterium]